MDLFMRCIISTKPFLSDPSLIPLPWTGLEVPLGRRLKIGIIANDGFIEPQPPVKRALCWASTLLSDAKYEHLVEIKDFKVDGAADAWSKIQRMFWPEGVQTTKDAIASTGEPIHLLTESITKEAEISGIHTAQNVSVMRGERNKFRNDFAKSWNKQDVDIVIGPASVGPASAHDTAFYWNYASLYNLVDYPGVVVPTPIKTEIGEKYDPDYVPLSNACQHVKELWEATDFQGAPINLQVVARRYHDNELFSALGVLKDILGLP